MAVLDGKFSVVLDKGTLDALATDDSQDTKTMVSMGLEVGARGGG